jgi:hypothetical protein
MACRRYVLRNHTQLDRTLFTQSTGAVFRWVSTAAAGTYRILLRVNRDTGVQELSESTQTPLGTLLLTARQQRARYRQCTHLGHSLD